MRQVAALSTELTEEGHRTDMAKEEALNRLGTALAELEGKRARNMDCPRRRWP